MNKKATIITPVYTTSPGTYYRINLLAKTLQLHDYKTFIASMDNKGSTETLIRRVYYRMGDAIVKLKPLSIALGLIGYINAKQLIPHEGVDVTVLMTDILAPLTRYMAGGSNRPLTILSIEDLTLTYVKGLRGQNLAPFIVEKEAHSYVKVLCSHLKNADYIMTPSYTLTSIINGGCSYFRATTVPIGIDPSLLNTFNYEEALGTRLNLAEKNSINILMAGQLHSPYDVKIAIKLIRLLDRLNEYSFRIYVFYYGKWNKLLISKLSNFSHVKLIPYNYSNLHRAMHDHAKAHLGLIISNRASFTLSRIYYYISLALPQLIYDSYGYLVSEMKKLNIKFVDIKNIVDTSNLAQLRLTLEETISHYHDFASHQYLRANQLLIPGIHRELIKFLGLNIK